ncbi:hypothetical protein ABZ512_08425 [Nocardiopsis dassonvillei]|uniref:hypothetical protein n=1 Tax=Nocardiopsis dassonvillei TaxID=2014 RepID=UPI00340C2AD1
MAEIERVRARPGGLVTLRLDVRGHTTRPLSVHGRVEPVFRWTGTTALIGLFPSFVPVWWANARGIEGGEALPYFLPVAVCLVVLLLTGLYYGAGEILATLALHALPVLLVVCFPLLLLPRVRRWARRTTDSRDQATAAGGGRGADGFREPVRLSRISSARLTQRGGRVTVTLNHLDGSAVDYSARGRGGEYLRAVFREHLDGRFPEEEPAAGAGPV